MVNCQEVEFIQTWFNYVKNEPKKHCKAIKDNVKLVKKIAKMKHVIYDPTDVEIFVEFCKMLRHLEGEWAGLPIELDREQKYIVACILGFKTLDEDGKSYYRVFNELILIVARKWGKSTFLSALNLYMLILDGEYGAQVWCVATEKAQARIVYDKCVEFAKNSKVIWKPDKIRTRKYDDGQRLYYMPSNSFMAAGSKNSKNKDGFNPHCCCVDECHAITDMNQYDVYKSGMGARRQPLMVVISTMGFERDSIFDKLYEKCKNILAGKEEFNGTFPMIFELDEFDDWEDKKTWIKANPQIGITPKYRYIEAQVQAAKNDPTRLPSTLAKHFNIATNSSISYFDMRDVNKCAGDLLEADYTDKYAVGGADLSETTDLCCASAIIPIAGKLELLQKYFIAEKRLAICSKQDKQDYQSFCNTKAEDRLSQEILEVVPGSFVTRTAVTNWFKQLRDEYDITFVKIGYDRWHGGEWIECMAEDGFPKCEFSDGKWEKGITFPVAQGYKTLSAPMKDTKILFQDKKIIYSKHNGLFRWCCNNTMAKIDVNKNIMPDKGKSKFRIDGYASFLMAYIAYLESKEIFDEYQS